ncbi:hypothetical protein Rsub_04795 [Raphidocelis subcapitata]|uniref:Mediator of RNA polymerase II transcription subunit 7 n=1 Tax=Raphidocelis subcapitata TaxID=307507 RepID=A0A2V0NU22_9CHLO|nr:hypothetical protein Rsub_04795 [Raphidocelis subcapitata]|eukprot:GBF91126.1 hypothetical protein Rsub_04795 [Raphidocelis subcapitata]
MAELGAVSQFPAPPHFYTLYRDGPSAGPPPPPAPADGDLTVLGAPFSLKEPLLPPLEVGALFTTGPDGTIDAKAELLRLNRALLVLFLELLSVLVDQPTAYAETLTRVICALQNMQHLVNVTRIQQARATLEFTLQQQIARKRAALDALRQTVAGVRERLGAAAAALAAAGGDAAESAPKATAAAAAAAGGAVAMDTS